MKSIVAKSVNGLGTKDGTKNIEEKMSDKCPCDLPKEDCTHPDCGNAKLLDVMLFKEYLPITMSIVTLGIVIWLLN